MRRQRTTALWYAGTIQGSAAWLEDLIREHGRDARVIDIAPVPRGRMNRDREQILDWIAALLLSFVCLSLVSYQLFVVVPERDASYFAAWECATERVGGTMPVEVHREAYGECMRELRQ